MSKTLIITLAIIGLIGVAGIFLLLLNQGILVLRGGTVEKEASELGTAVLERKDLRTYTDLNGTLEYGASVQIAPSHSGVLTYIAPEGSKLSRGSIIMRLYKSIGGTQILAAEQQIASAKASLAQAELSLENLKTPPTSAQIASADASVTQAELALENITAPSTAAQIASADASVTQAELALENITAPSTAAQIASADASVAQAQLALENIESPATTVQIAAANATVTQREAALIAAEDTVETAWELFRVSRKTYCDRANQVDPREWRFLESICPAANTTLTDAAAKSLTERMLTVDQMIAETRNLLNTHRDSASAIASRSSAVNSLTSARSSLAALSDLPSAAQLAQASEALKSAKAHRAALNEPPSTSEVAHATEVLKSANEHRAVLNEPPSTSEVAHATEVLKSANEHRAALNEPPTVSELAQATAYLQSAKASLETTIMTREELVEGPSAVMLMFGDIPAWREFSLGMSPGEDVAQLKENLIALGYASAESVEVDQNFDSKSTEAIIKMQADLGLPRLGHIPFGDIIFLPGTSVIEYSTSFPNLGATVNQGVPLIALVTTERVDTRIGANGKVVSQPRSLQVVETTIEVADQELIDVGSAVKIELPDEEIVQGTVRSIGSIAVIPTGNQAAAPYLEVSISIAGDKTFPQWTGAPVIVSVTKELASNVLAAPVTSLVALLGGGYALEVLEEGTTRLVAVEAGIYSDGWVEVDGVGLEEGTTVVAPL